MFCICLVFLSNEKSRWDVPLMGFKHNVVFVDRKNPVCTNTDVARSHFLPLQSPEHLQTLWPRVVIPFTQFSLTFQILPLSLSLSFSLCVCVFVWSFRVCAFSFPLTPSAFHNYGSGTLIQNRGAPCWARLSQRGRNSAWTPASPKREAMLRNTAVMYCHPAECPTVQPRGQGCWWICLHATFCLTQHNTTQHNVMIPGWLSSVFPWHHYRRHHNLCLTYDPPFAFGLMNEAFRAVSQCSVPAHNVPGCIKPSLSSIHTKVWQTM